ncbi:hypothetical protein Vau01_121260 [Virgisporangium aurantiacum]|uniref:Non-specific serine/threonine protein kinase n=1 Tax=Virgisporangium aurantiacum TaxID=175570 RepID=A0A8J3ZND6_9ACTN|nr:hypothetical protein Vau01_121260 [Virgisporangium aurantiacum]
MGAGVEAVEALGRGANAAVYRVRRAGVEYALKTLNRVGDETALVDFCREAALLARVNHPGVPKVFDVAVAAGRPYLILEFVEGHPLTVRLRTGPLPVGEVMRLGADLASALHAAHGAGLVHRDVKPANVVITDSGRARLIDFGLAVSRVSSGGAARDVAAGTFDYAAPEQVGMLARPVDGRSDLYALGVLLFHCATGQLPFQADNVAALLALHATAAVPDPRRLRPDLPADLARLIIRLMAKDPDDRAQTAREVHEALAPDVGELAAVDALVGREDEQQRLAESWSLAQSGQGRVVLLEGPAGVGKSVLARQIGDTARSAGAAVLAGKCDLDSPLPLAPLRSAVDGYVRTVAALPAEPRAEAVAELRAAAGLDTGLLAPLSSGLAALLDAPPDAVVDRHEQFAAAVASLLCGLARRRGGLLLVLDDVQWLDLASREVLRRLAEELPKAPLLLLATTRDEADTADFVVDVGNRMDLRLPIRPLDGSAAARLVASHLAGCTVGREVVDELTARGRGNPLTILEYLHALIDAGALRPSWGTWRLDADRLHSVDLPTDVVELILARIDGLGGRAHEILTVAAALGSRFEPDVLAGVVAADPAPALAEAAGRGLLQLASDGCAFVHDRIREALLSTVDTEALRGLHRRIAAVLATRHRTDPSGVYELARHCAGGGVEHEPERLYRAGWAAGRLALAEHAPDAAVSFLESASAGAAAAGIRPASRFCESLAVAYLTCGDAASARRHLEPALEAETVPLRRAALLLHLAHAHRARWAVTDAIECVRDGLAELGRPMSRNPIRLGLSFAGFLSWWLLTGRRRPARRPVVGEEAERLRLNALLCRAGAAAAAMGMRIQLVLTFNARSIRGVHRLGPSVEYAMVYAGMGIMAAGLHLAGRKRKIFRVLSDMADGLGNPQVIAFLAWTEALANFVGGTGAIAQQAEVVERYGRWLEPDHYAQVVLMRVRDLTARGYASEAVALLENTRRRVATHADDQFFVLALAETTARSLLGQPVDAPASLSRLGEPGLEVAYELQLALTAIQLGVEQDDLGQQFEAALCVSDRLRISPTALWPECRMLLASAAYGRLAQCVRATGHRKRALLPTAAVAVRRLCRTAKDPLLRALHVVARASLSQLQDKPLRALAQLASAERALVLVDAPVVHFEAARVRARALRALGHDVLACQHAGQAAALAARHGWAARLRWIRAEFEVESPGTGSYTPDDDPTGDRYRRRLEALQQVSAAAAKVLDPQRLACVALDETLRILSAERAVLFLRDADGQLRPNLARTAAGELVELGGYSASLVEQVAASREPLIVTSGDEGAALGSQSTVIHGLRSIMIAPLELDGRLLGAVYLDSRVAKGMFTGEDIGILTAVACQVAVSLETARAAQLEAAVHAARQQRDTAEALREAMNELAATLDPEQVLDTLRAIVARLLVADRVCLLHREDGQLIVAPADTGPDSVDVASLALSGPRCGDATNQPAKLAALLDGVESWLVVPLATRGYGAGVLIAGSATPNRFGPAELDIATALAGQGGTAYANARLFAQVQQLATTDGLTGLYNRRHFTELATRQVDIAARNHRPLAAMMIDIDHFKAINDTYGHGAGDDVIRAVAAILRTKLREPDLTCRYGGEEYALVLSEMHNDPLEVAERLRVAVTGLAVPCPARAAPIRATVSIGVAELKPDDRLDTLLARADEALYRAKQAGRNTVKTG